MPYHIRQGLETIENTLCVVCNDDYGDIADECFVAGACEDCIAKYSNEELIELVS